MANNSSRKMSKCVRTSRKKDDENGSSEVPITWHCSDSSQETLDEDGDTHVSIKETLPSRPMRAAKVKCLQQLPTIATRLSEGVEKHEQHLEQKPHIVSKCRPNETPEQRKRRLETKRRYAKQCLANETAEQREIRLEKSRLKYLKHKATESVEEHERRLERKREHYASTFKKKETDEHRKRRLERQRHINAKRKASETDEERKRRMEKSRHYEHKRKANETVEEREKRLARARQYDLKRRANENIEKRMLRREREREYSLKWKAKNKIRKGTQCLKSLQMRVAGENGEQHQLTEDIKHQDSVINFKNEPNTEEYDEYCDKTSLKSVDLNQEARSTRAAKVKCLQYLSEVMSEESSSGVPRHYRYQQHKGVEEHAQSPKNLKRVSKCIGNENPEILVTSQKMNKQQYALKHRTNQSVEPSHQRLQNLEDGPTEIVGEGVGKHEQHHYASQLIANETVEHYGETDRLIHREMDGESKNTDVMTQDMKHHDFVIEVKTEPSTEEYDQFCDNTASKSIEDVNSHENANFEFVSVDGISSKKIKTENNVILDNEYEVKPVIKMEIDIEPEVIQRITFDGKSSMVDNNFEDIKDVTLNPPKKRLKRDVTVTDDVETNTAITGKKCHRTKRIGNKNVAKSRKRREKPAKDRTKGTIIESAEERELRLEKKRQYRRQMMANETAEERQQRLARIRAYRKQLMTKESAEIRQRRLERQRKYMEQVKASETDEEREKRLERNRQYDLKRRTIVDGEQQELLRNKQREYMKQWQANKRAERRMQHIENQERSGK